jgi:titin
MGRRDRANRIVTLLATAGLAACAEQLPVAPNDTGDGVGGLSAAKGGPSALAAPSGATAADDGWNQAVVRWQDNSNETGFEVQRATTDSGPFIVRTTVGANTLVFNDSGLDVHTQYCYRIRAVGVVRNKPSYSAFSNIACVPARVAPTIAPSQLTAVAVSETRIDLTWQDNSSNETSFEIAHSGNGETGNFFHLATASPNAVAYSHQGLQAATRHCYQVRALQAVSSSNGTVFFYSAPTAPVCATTPAPPAPPPPSAPPPAAYVVRATPLNTSVWVAVTWTLASPAPLFRIYRSTNGGALWEPISLPGSGGSYVNEPVLTEQQVCYRVVAYNAVGDAAPSAPGCTTPPAGPTLVSGVVVAGMLELIWTDNSAVEEGYEVWVFVGQGSPDNAGWSESEWLVTVLPPNSTSYREEVGPPIPYSSLTYCVVARKDGGRSNSICMVVW